MHIKKTCVFSFFFYKCKRKISLSTNTSKHCKQRKLTTTLHPTNKPQVSLKFDITSLERKAHKGKQANKFGMKSLSNKNDINKGQEGPSINLNLQTKVAQYLVQQGQDKEGGGGGSRKNKYMFFLIFFHKSKRKTTYKLKACR